jgi:predicted TPR repeat methyltransferase
MPTSSIWGKHQTTNWFRENQQNIKRLLDVGVGSGTYIQLIKEQNNICTDTEWVGVEVWEPYIEKYRLKDRYNSIINQDVRTIAWPELGHFDVAVAGDILEHMTKNEAIKLVDGILSVTDVLIVSIPVIHYPQGEYEGNPYEEHVKPDWSHNEMIETWPSLITHYWVHPQSDVGVYWMRKP